MTTATAPAEAGAVAFPGPPAVLITTATRASRERPGAMPRSRTTLRVGAVNYLNSKPLIERLTDFAPSVELSLDLPSRLADRMAAGGLDVGLIPVVEFFRGDGYSFVPNIAIASRGPVLSVTLFS